MSRGKMSKRQKQLLCLVLGGTLIFGGPERAAAEEAEAAEFSLDEYVVTANRMPTKRTETAANITVVSREEMEQKNITTVKEALNQAGVQVDVEGGGNSADNSYVTLNGDKRVVILVDGRRINWEQQVDNAQTGYSLGMLPDLNNVEKIEVVRGAASSLYGSSGVGGVINIITRKGTENRTTALTEFGSWGARRYSLQTSGKSGDTGYMVTAERQTQDYYEYKDPATGKVVTMPNSDFTRETASLRIDKDLGNDRTLTFYFDHLSEDSGYPVAKPGFAFYCPDASRHTIQNNLSLAYRWQQGENITNNLQIYRNHYNGFWHRYKYNINSSRYELEADGIEWNQTRRLSDRHTLLGGFDWRSTRIDYISYLGETIDPSNTYTGRNLRNLGLFLEDRWTLDSRWTFTAGMRYDDPNEYADKSTARLSLNRKINDTTNAYLSWGQVYRGPNAVDLFMPEGTYYRKNPNLRPERGQTATLGINTKLPGGTAIQASLFSTQLKDAFKDYYDIDPVNYTYTREVFNIAQQKKKGFDLMVTQPFAEHWNLTAGYSYLQVKEDDGDPTNGTGYQSDITNSNPHAYRLGIHYHNNAWNVSAALRGATGRSLEAFTSRQYWVTDLAASYQVTPDVKVYAKVYNLTNRAYETAYMTGWNAVGGLPMASRQIVFGVEGRL
ncbi:TonB-dependent receptor plug domain-containing protein [Sporomusa sphaeroides]|nr:TonB-dependent receptor [Sporomusa sphaeroides]